MDREFLAVVLAGVLLFIVLSVAVYNLLSGFIKLVAVPEEEYTYVVSYTTGYYSDKALFALMNYWNRTILVHRVAVCGALSEPATIRLSWIDSCSSGHVLLPAKLDPGAPPVNTAAVSLLHRAEGVSEVATISQHVLREGCVVLYERTQGLQPIVVQRDMGVAIFGSGNPAYGNVSYVVVFTLR